MMSRLSISLLLSASIGCSMLFASCGSSRSSNATVYKTTPVGKGGPTKPDRKTFEIPQSLAPQSHALLAEARQWIGTPYKYGGEDRNGVDCSGLVLNVYRSALKLKLPRNSAEQASFCTPLDKGALIPGDLLFFDTTGGGGKKVSHVGIYVGDGMMVHSSSSKGVIVSDINAEYFRRTYAGAGCVDQYRALIASAPTSAPAPTSTPATPAQTSQPQDVNSPFKFTPVESLPSRKGETRETSKPAPASKPTPTTQTPAASKTTKAPIQAAQQTSTTTSSEPSPDEARKKVLESLIEQKLDSIFNK